MLRSWGNSASDGCHGRRVLVMSGGIGTGQMDGIVSDKMGSGAVGAVSK